MLQRVLKLFLWLILLCCVAWGSAVLFGPSLLSTIAKKNFKDEIVFIDLKVTPKLVITASRVEFNDFKLSDGKSVTGFSRAIELKVGKIFSGSPVIYISVGPSLVNEVGGLKSQLITFSVPKLSLNGPIEYFYTGKGLKINNYLFAEDVALKGNISLSSFQMNDVVFDVKDADFSGAFFSSVGKIYGKVDGLTLTSWPDLEASNVSLELTDLFSKNSGLYVPQSKIDMLDTHLDTNSLREIIIEAERIENEERTLGLGRFRINIQGQDISNGMWDTAGLSLVSLRLNPKGNLKGSVINTDLSGALSGDAFGDLEVNVEGILNEAKVLIKNTFVANLNGLEYNSQWKVNQDKFFSISSFAKNSPIDMTANAELSANLFNENLLTCLLGNCTIQDIEANYGVSINKELLKGKTSCPDLTCSNEATTQLTTNHTVKFFSNLIAANILNPIYTALLFQQFKNGSPIGDGHRVNF